MNTHTIMRGDIPLGNWIDRWVPGPVRPYLRLMRLDRPIGTWLLLFPCWWSITLAGSGLPDLWLMLLFALGALIMRGAGCTINDIADHKFDAMVERTKARPIPSGAVSLSAAWVFLGLQLLAGLLILLQLNPVAIWWGIGSLALVFPYPLMKRITWWPQAWLGLTFNWGALLGWVAVTGRMDAAPALLYAAGLFWTLGYDTIYAHQDKDDDSLIGVKSSALRLGERTRPAVTGFYAATIILAACAGWAAGLHWAFYPMLILPALQLLWQVRGMKIDVSLDCLAKFKSNRLFGWCLLAAFAAGKAL